MRGALVHWCRDATDTSCVSDARAPLPAQAPRETTPSDMHGDEGILHRLEPLCAGMALHGATHSAPFTQSGRGAECVVVVVHRGGQVHSSEVCGAEKSQ